ncbi:MOSC domain-containing protein [Halopseudomonas nanhaiensis]|uniref:MOSC domain-containing protein n=1 Tax=Halopseudomonas nanhaiensis TaxID=2830842 RepID=UPI001CBB629A|nr:MOSC domain-containing protein [Halopseudomonas nanhaiensis]UAW96916.1 MOSC domain-containing protein [Halopseudomonas nanhaiensis]
MRLVGTIKEIWRYPVKGMGGERVGSSRLTDVGVDGDREWAVRDVLRDEIQSCKFRPDLLRCTASHEPGSTVPLVELPTGERLSCNDPGLGERLSALVGHASRLEPLQSNEGLDRFRRYHGGANGWLDELKATFDREEGEPLPDLDGLPPSVADFVVSPGTFFLVAPLHIVTTASLERLAQLREEADWDVRRFRPNLVIETTADFAGFPEQEWIGRTLRLGGATVKCTAPAPRCGAITRAQRDFGADTRVLRTVVRHAEQNVGVYGQTAQAGLVQRGEQVWCD